MDLKNTFGELVDKLRKARPVIHEITNYVTAESCADAALAAGADRKSTRLNSSHL